MDAPPPAPPLPDTHSAYARDDWALLRKKAILVGLKRHPGKPARALDLAHRAILKCLLSKRIPPPWTWAHERLVGWLALRVKKIDNRELERARRFPEIPAAEDFDYDEDDPSVGHAVAVLRSPIPDAEALAIAAEAERIYRRRVDALVRDVADDALLTLLVAEVQSDSDSPIAAALAQRHTREDVYVARKRLERAALAVLEEEKKKPMPASKQVTP